MDIINSWLESRLELVLFIDGLAFLIMGITVLVQPKEASQFRIANILWLLALFGVTHGAHELLAAWAIIDGSNYFFDLVRWLVFVVSYYFLFEFGRQFLRMSIPVNSKWQKRTSGLFVWWLIPLTGLLIILGGIQSAEFWYTGRIWTRYILGLPGSLLTGAAFLLYYRQNRNTLGPLKAAKHFFSAGAAFFIYGTIGGTIVSQGNFFPANTIDTGSFLHAIYLPVQMLCALCAIVAAWAIRGMLQIFSWEIRGKLQDAQFALKAQLKKTEEFYFEMLERSSDLIYSVDNHGVIFFVNKRGCDLLGYTKKEVIGRRLSTLYTRQTWEKIERGIHNVDFDESLFIDNGEMTKKDGSTIDVEVHSQAMFDDNRIFRGARLTVRDITDRKRAEEALQKAHDKLEVHVIERTRELVNANERLQKEINETINLRAEAIKSSHLAALGELAAGVAHEINNPINGIINYAQILTTITADNNRENNIAKEIMFEGNRIACIVKNLLSSAHERQEWKRPVTVNEILFNTVILTESQLKKEGIALQVNVPHDLPKVVVHSHKIHQVFLNIINNARYALKEKYNGSHKEKTIEILAKEITIDKNRFVNVTFQDWGTGIPSSVIDKVMNPFYTTKPAGKGTGLGLSTSYGIINEHGGQLKIDSTEGEYTKVSINLPAATEIGD